MKKMQASRPNILLITTDQHRADCVGFENKIIKTPHIDRLAREGTRFSACITPNLVCQPSRASILTGMLPLTHGVWDNGVDLDPKVGELGFAATLQRAGYQTGFIGKAHFSTKSTFNATGTPECNKSQSQYGPDWMGPYMGFEHCELTALGHLHRNRPLEMPPVGHYERWLLSRGSQQEALSMWAAQTREGSGAAQTWASALPAAWHSSTWIADRAIDWLTKASDQSSPFCAWVSFPDPHHAFDCPEPWSRMYDPKDMVLPKHRTKDLEQRPWWHKASLESSPKLADPVMLKFRAEGSRVADQTDAQLAEMTANYYGMISQVDFNMGRILSALEAAGVAQNTLVIFTTDHGDLLGHHGLYLKGPTPYEDLLRVSLVVRGPGVAQRQLVVEPVSTLDIADTLYEYAGVARPAPIQSRSLRTLLQGGAQTRDMAYSEWHVHPSRCGVSLKLRTVRTKTHKCTFELDSGAGELYDLENDPEEMHNLYEDPGYAPLRQLFYEWMLARPGEVLEPLSEPIGMA
jgi:arylsulfatase A-like enzyme